MIVKNVRVGASIANVRFRACEELESKVNVDVYIPCVKPAMNVLFPGIASGCTKAAWTVRAMFQTL